jgi:D-lactate dehydrogenase
MKAVAYSVKPFEKEFLARANQKKHDITLISNDLSPETAIYAEGKEAVIVLNDDVNASILDQLANLGVKYIATRYSGISHIDTAAAAARHIKIAAAPYYSPQPVAELAVGLALALARHISNHDEVDFNFLGKTVGIIGLGKIGLAVAKIYTGMGCNVIAYDPAFSPGIEDVKQVDFKKLLSSSHIISLHVPLTPGTWQFINRKAFDQVQPGVMLINTSSADLINTEDALTALKSGQLGYLGIDADAYEKEPAFEDHEKEREKDLLLARLTDHPNVLVTAHQASLTMETIQSIAYQMVNNLDQWQNEQRSSADEACAKIGDLQEMKEPITQIKHVG